MLFCHCKCSEKHKSNEEKDFFEVGNEKKGGKSTQEEEEEEQKMKSMAVQKKTSRA